MCYLLHLFTRCLLCAASLAFLAQTLQAALFQHLDASVAGSVVDSGGGVLTWLDQSGNGRDAIALEIDVGTIQLSMDESIWPRFGNPGSPLNSVQFSGGRERMQLLDATDTATLLDQSQGGDLGFAVLVVVRGIAMPPATTWNDLIGNTTNVNDGFLMRWNNAQGNFQTSLDKGSVNGTNQENGLFAGRLDAAAVVGMTYDSSTGELIQASTLDGYSEMFNRTPLDLSIGSGGTNTLGLAATNSSNRFFNGNYGEVKIYDAALTAEEFADELAALDEKWLVGIPGTPGDVNGDELVNEADLNIINMNLYKTMVGGVDVTREDGDLNRNGIVDHADYRIWTNSNPVVVGAGSTGVGPVPEPASLGIALLGGLALLGIRRRSQNLRRSVKRRRVRRRIGRPR